MKVKLLGLTLACAVATIGQANALPVLAGAEGIAGVILYDNLGATSASGSFSGTDSGTGTPFSSVSSADLATGQMHINARSAVVPLDSHGFPAINSLEVTTEARLFDGLNISNTTGHSLTGFLNITFDGTISSQIGGLTPRLLTNVNMGATAESINLFNASGCSASPPNKCFVGSAFDFTVAVPFAIRLGAFDYALTIVSEATAQDGEIVNFGSTESLGVDLPDGLTFTSDSGVFLTAATSSVPEPSTIATFGFGLAILGFARRYLFIARRERCLAETGLAV